MCVCVYIGEGVVWSLQGWEEELNLNIHFYLFMQQTSIEHLEHLRCSAKICVELEIIKCEPYFGCALQKKEGDCRTLAKELCKSFLVSLSIFKLETHSEFFFLIFIFWYLPVCVCMGGHIINISKEVAWNLDLYFDMSLGCYNDGYS